MSMFTLLTGSYALAADISKDHAQRVIKASGALQLMQSGKSAKVQACMEKEWNKALPQVNKVYVDNFTSEELNSIANFFESTTGVRYVKALEIGHADRFKPMAEQRKPDFKPEEAEAVKAFYQTPAGKKFVDSEEAKTVTNETMMIGMQVGIACGKIK